MGGVEPPAFVCFANNALPTELHPDLIYGHT